MGLVRLKKSVRIVNHPPTQPETIAPPAGPDEAAQARRKPPKTPTVSLIDNKHNS